ncbi:glycosyltransferase family 2 protein [Spirosoma agri]|uniref:Glycosyltransferase family 2 protein n=1 Tax=Spirosoma agri TaxID=1987381 RepID=A0A6M0ICV8_9BACT|nr:glycosyltransferase family A protein [Spirosoma agri]NEU65595.1 glycosyltransferase family 2 protein [Spirosoma agri]
MSTPTPSQPLVSIVIPVYNQKLQYLREALESAFAQTYTHLEVVVSDNHSTNDVPAYLASVTDTRLRVRKPDQFLPMAQNFQFAADQATGEFVVFLCSDDYLYPNFVRSLIPELIERPNTSFGYAELECVEHYDLEKIRFFYHRKDTAYRPANESLLELLNVRPLLGFFPSLIMRRSAYQQIRHLLSGEFFFAFDVAIVFSLHELGDVFYLNKPLGKVRYWTAIDGKTSDDRFLEFISDAGKLCTLVEQSSVLAPGNPTVREWRLFQARRWLLVALFWSVRGNISVEKTRRGIDQVEQQIARQPIWSSLLLWSLGNPQAKLLRPLFRGTFQTLWSLQSLIKKPM